MNDNVKWRLFSIYLADQAFKVGFKPDPVDLEELLQQFEVPLEKIEEAILADIDCS